MSTPTPAMTPNTSTPPRATDQQYTARLIAELAAANAGIQNESGAHFITLPPGHQLHDISKAIEAVQTQPDRLRGRITLCAIDSFIAACARQVEVSQGGDHDAAVHGCIYADPDARTLTAIFNDQAGGNPAWRDHGATFKAEYTPEFERWLRHNGGGAAMDQLKFAEFIEDNFADIQAPGAQTLLDVATTLQAKTDIDFKSAKRLDNGQNQITYVETINASAGTNGALTIPKEFDIGVRIFKNGDGYKLHARLKYRLTGGGVKFWYELDRPERAVEDAFAGYVDKVRAGAGIRVLIGKA